MHVASQLVLSLFHGADLFGRGFDEIGFTVVRAAEIDLGFDVRNFHPPAGRFDGIIAGTPCQDFSLANRTKRTYSGYGREMIEQFIRIVTETRPAWFVLENVPTVPSVEIPGYTVQRFDLNANECGLGQNRLRHFQFGSLAAKSLILLRAPSQPGEPCLTVTEGRKTKERRSFRRFCELQGLPPDYDLPYFKLSERYKVIGNGVPVPMARIVAAAVRDALAGIKPPASHRPCACNCGRLVTGKARTATAACRKRIERKKTRPNHSKKILENSQEIFPRRFTDFSIDRSQIKLPGKSQAENVPGIVTDLPNGGE